MQDFWPVPDWHPWCSLTEGQHRHCQYKLSPTMFPGPAMQGTKISSHWQWCKSTTTFHSLHLRFFLLSFAAALFMAALHLNPLYPLLSCRPDLVIWRLGSFLSRRSTCPHAQVHREIIRRTDRWWFKLSFICWQSLYTSLYCWCAFITPAKKGTWDNRLSVYAKHQQSVSSIFWTRGLKTGFSSRIYQAILRHEWCGASMYEHTCLWEYYPFL